MRYFEKTKKKKTLYLTMLIMILVFSRLIPHPPNFTPIISVAILCGIIFETLLISVIVLIGSMFISDLIIGLHSGIMHIYICLIFISYLFFKFSKKINYKNLIFYSFLGSIIFFLYSNFIVWISSGLYSKDLKGILECYILAIPFFSNTLFSTIFYSYITFIAINFIKNDFNLVMSKQSKL